MRRFLMMSFLAGLLALTAVAADVTGKWVARMAGRNGQTHDVTFTFKAEGNVLTGTVTTRRGDVPISDGKIDGNHISFNQTMEFNGNTVRLSYRGTLAGDEIKLTRTREGGGGRSQEFIAKRVP